MRQLIINIPPRRGPHPPILPPRYADGLGSDSCEIQPCLGGCIEPGQPMVPDPNNPSYCPKRYDHILPPAPCPYAFLSPAE